MEANTPGKDAVTSDTAPPPATRLPVPPGTLALMGAFAVLVVANYLPTFRWMIDRWEEEGSYMSHGWLIPPITAFLLWTKREELARPSSPSALGWLLILPALFLHLVSGIADVASISGMTLIPLLLGLVLLIGGPAKARAAWFPIAFLLCMVPPPEFIISGINFRLKFLASDLAAGILNLTGLPAVRTGSFMLFGEEKLAIGDVCSGLRSLLSLLSIGILYAWLVRAKGKANVIAVLAATVPAAVIGNGLRIGLVSYLVYFLGSDAVFKPLVGSWDLHLVTGSIIFLGALAVLVGVDYAVESLNARRKT